LTCDENVTIIHAVAKEEKLMKPSQLPTNSVKDPFFFTVLLSAPNVVYEGIIKHNWHF